MQVQPSGIAIQDSVVGGDLHTGNVVHNHYHLVQKNPRDDDAKIIQPVGCASSGQLEERQLSDAYLLWFLFGLLGGHRFYLRDFTGGFLYFFTIGFFGIGWFVDAFRLPSLVQSSNNDLSIQSHHP
ncbi:MAG: NINE protein [Candidatus Thalassarchaeaceae archaeon]|nr:NINE protein [Candidatus Thalassarchaeaceae archaeon]